jgi:fatty acid desaturase
LGDTRAHPGWINVLLGVVHVAINIYQFLLLPLWLLPSSTAWAWTLLPLAFLNNSFWSLIHEAIHDLFHRNPRINLRFGRAAAVLLGAPFRVLRLSHLLHHKLNRTPKEATELYDAAESSMLRAAWGYYFQIFGGLYLVEFLSSVLFFLPRAWIRTCNKRFIQPQSVSGILMQSWTKNEAIREIRTDGALVVAWLGLSLWCYGENWPWLVALLCARGFSISFLDNVYHYRTPVNDIFFARNLWLPLPLATLLLNFNLHGIHHQNPGIPWTRLPMVFHERAAVYHGNYFAAATAQLNGPVALEELAPAPVVESRGGG